MKHLVTSSWAWFDRFYTRFAKILLIVCLITATGGVIIGTTAQVQSGKAVQANKTLTECLNRYSAAQSLSSQAVRDASELVTEKTVLRDIALDEEGEAFQRLVDSLRAKKYKPAILDALSDALAGRAEAATALQSAQDNLSLVRADNPVVPPPATFCRIEQNSADNEGVADPGAPIDRS